MGGRAQHDQSRLRAIIQSWFNAQAAIARQLAAEQQPGLAQVA
jgi:hypothetical protein